MYDALVVADDLTGAIDTGQQFAKAGLHSVVVDWPTDDAPKADVLVVETATRPKAPEEAAETVSAVVSTFEAETVYDKIDSTLRGNVASELAASLEHAGPGVVPVAPAFPGSGRTTVGGQQLVDGAPITASSDYEGENAPSTSDIVRLLSGLDVPIRHVPIDVIAEGLAAVSDEFEGMDCEDRNVVAVCDATADAHLSTIANAGRRAGAPLYVGSAGLAKFVGPAVGSDGENPVLGVVGSTNERTIEQLSAVSDEHVAVLDAEAALSSPRRAGEAAGLRAAKAIDTSNLGVLASVTSSSAVEETYRKGAELDLSRTEVETRVLRALTIAAEVCLDRSDVRNLFASGGTVAKSVLESADTDVVELTGREVEDGIPIARFERADGTPVRVVTKAGGFGDPDTLTRCLDYLRYC